MFRYQLKLAMDGNMFVILQKVMVLGTKPKILSKEQKFMVILSSP